MPIAPHEGSELNLVLKGTKPFASIEYSKQPEQFRRAKQLTGLSRRLSVVQHTADLLTVTLQENRELHDVFSILSYKSDLLVRSAAEKHRLLGRLFGYSEEDIDTFIATAMFCTCPQCEWASDD